MPNAIEDAIRLLLRRAGLEKHAHDESRHIDAEIFERLTGTVDSSNRVFRSTYMPDPDVPVQFWFRGLDRDEGGSDEGDFVNDGYGRLFVMNAAPIDDGEQTDLAPKVRYRRSFAVALELDSDTAPALLRRRLPVYVPSTPRRRPAGVGVIF